MSPGDETPFSERRRLWLLRTLELSPLIVLLLGLALWFAVPSEQRSESIGAALAYRSSAPTGERPDPLEVSLRTAIRERDKVALPDGSYSYSSDFDVSNSELRATAGRVAAELSARDPKSGGTSTVAANPAARAAIARYEKEKGSDVIALVVNRVSPAPVAYIAAENLFLLKPDQLEEIREKGTAELLRAEVIGDDSLDWQAIGTGSGGALRSGVSADHNTAVINGRVYESYAIYPSELQATDLYIDLMGVPDASDKRLRREMDRIAKRSNGVAVLVGPLDEQPTLLRAPASLSASEALLVGRSVWEVQLSPNTPQEGQPRRVPAAARKYLPSRTGWSTTAIRQSTDVTTGGSPAVALIELSRTNPSVGPLTRALLKQPWLIAQSYVAAALPALAGVLAALFLVSLVVSPAAFAYERRSSADREIELERDRLQREARRRVLERLEGLSARMDRAAEESRRSREEVHRVAADIEATITDLRRLLGEANGGAVRDE